MNNVMDDVTKFAPYRSEIAHLCEEPMTTPVKCLSTRFLVFISTLMLLCSSFAPIEAQTGCPASTLLTIRKLGQVISDSPNNMRALPDPDSEKVGQIPGG